MWYGCSTGACASLWHHLYHWNPARKGPFNNSSSASWRFNRGIDDRLWGQIQQRSLRKTCNNWVYLELIHGVVIFACFMPTPTPWHVTPNPVYERSWFAVMFLKEGTVPNLKNQQRSGLSGEYPDTLLHLLSTERARCFPNWLRMVFGSWRNPYCSTERAHYEMPARENSDIGHLL